MNPKRELSNTDQEVKWSEWLHALSPIKKNQWWLRDEINLNKNGVLKTTGGGIYEIGVRSADEGEIICIYVGRATKVRKDVKGVTLRARIYSGYGWNGSDFRYELNEYLENGCHIYVRVCYLSTVTECIETEAYLFQTYDYAHNKAGSLTPYRPPDKVLLKKNVFLLESLLNQETNIIEQIKQLLANLDAKQKQNILKAIMNI